MNIGDVLVYLFWCIIGMGLLVLAIGVITYGYLREQERMAYRFAEIEAGR